MADSNYMTVNGTLACLLICLCPFLPTEAYAKEWFVASGATGEGARLAPMGTIQQAIDAAQPGDTVTVQAGRYTEVLRTVRAGRPGLPIQVRVDGPRGSVVVTAPGRVLSVAHPYLVVEGFVLDGQFGADDTVRVTPAGSGFVLRNVEVRRSSRDLIDILGGRDILIEGCLIHHALNAADGRSDAHGVVAGPVSNFVLRDSEIHTFSGDGFQVDPGRSAPGWSQVTIERVRFWLKPLPEALNGFAAGTVPGENAVDTKASTRFLKGTIVIRDVTASGFRNGLINNMAAFNLKATVFDSEIAFRLRGTTQAELGGAEVSLRNVVVYNVDTAFRYENDVQRLRIWNGTIGRDVGRAFQAAEAPRADMEVRNLLILGARPAEAAHASNLSTTPAAFRNAQANDYRLRPGSPAIDRGVRLPEMTIDRAGVARPQGTAFDVGAFEWKPSD
jgi:hypothetical protein